eukprot:11173325-Lingulodinium_polyedra.AAC.1
MRGALYCRATAFQYVTNVRFRPICTFLAEAQKGNGIADRVSHHLANGTVAHAIVPTVSKMYTRQFDDDKRIRVVSN